MSKQAFSIAEDETQEGRGLVPSGGATEEMPVHAKARPIPEEAPVIKTRLLKPAVLRSIAFPNRPECRRSEW